jgi:hypothetical protein
MNTAKGMASSAVSAFANIPAVSETVDQTFNMPGLTKQTSEYLQSKLHSTPVAPPPPPPKADKWPLLFKAVGGVVAIALLYFGIHGFTKTQQIGSVFLSAEPPREGSKEDCMERKKKRMLVLVALIASAVLVWTLLYLPSMKPVRSWFAKMWTGSPARSRTLSSRRSYYPPRSCRYQLKTK